MIDNKLIQKLIKSNTVETILYTESALERGKIEGLIESGSVAHQEKSGRCWIFAGINMIKSIVISKFGKCDELSPNYIYFWDKYERSVSFISYYKKISYKGILDREAQYLLTNPVQDG